MTTPGEIKRLFHREVQRYASQQATPVWRGAEIRAEWSELNLAAVERLARRVLDLPDDDPRFAAVAVAYAGQEWRLREPYPWNPSLDGWLGTLGNSAAGALNDPDEFVSNWAAATLDHARRWRPPEQALSCHRALSCHPRKGEAT